jgi:hypothetical protein
VLSTSLENCGPFQTQTALEIGPRVCENIPDRGLTGTPTLAGPMLCSDLLCIGRKLTPEATALISNGRASTLRLVATSPCVNNLDHNWESRYTDLEKSNLSNLSKETGSSPFSCNSNSCSTCVLDSFTPPNRGDMSSQPSNRESDLYSVSTPSANFGSSSRRAPHPHIPYANVHFSSFPLPPYK